MPGVLQPTQSSRANIEAFLATVEDEDLRELLRENLDLVLAIGKAGSITAAQRESQELYAAMNRILDSTGQDDHEA